MNRWILFLMLLFVQLKSFTQLTSAKYLLPGSTLLQNFDQLPSTGTINITGKGPHALDQILPTSPSLMGWQILQIAGSQSNTNLLTGTGSGTGSGMYSFGLSGNSNRALGSLASGTGIYAFGVVIENLTGTFLNKISFSVKATQWRKGGSGNSNTWRFSYQTRQLNSIDTSNLMKINQANLVSIHTSTGSATLNGHLTANQYTVQVIIDDVVWKPGEKLILRWEDQDEAGSDDGMAIDDFSFSATAEMSPPSILPLTIDSIGARIAKIKTIINDKLSNTQIRFEYDTISDIPNPISISHVTPESIAQGSGNTDVIAELLQLMPGKTYYIRAIASNSVGTTISDPFEISTLTTIPDVSTDSVITDSSGKYTVYAKILADNGSTVIESGFCWSTNNTPTINDTTLLASSTDSIIIATFTDLPTDSKIFVRAYARNQKGIAYGIPILIHTPVSVVSFSPTIKHSNKDTLHYQLQFRRPVDSILIDNFSIHSTPDHGAQIFDVEKKNDSCYGIKILSGLKDAIIFPVLHKHPRHYPAIHLPQYEGNKIIFDKTAPEIAKIQIPDRSYKIKDTIPISIYTRPESETLIMKEGNLSGYPVSGLRKIDDSTYHAFSIITAGGSEIEASAEHIAIIRLEDSAGNQNLITTFKIVQDNDAIDHTRPFIKNLILPERKKYKAYDSLYFILTANEKISCDTSLGKPALAVTIGTRIRNPILTFQSDTSLFFSYIIQPDESDVDGIRLANTITLNNSIIRDPAGNILVNNIPSAGIIADILVDATLPTIIGVSTPPAKLYGLGDTLLFHVIFSEFVYLNPNQTPFLETVIGNSSYKIPYLYGAPGNKLSFQLIVQKGMLDKNGITLTSALVSNNAIVDDIGNPAIPLLKSIGALSSIDIDGIPPQWLDSTATILSVCKSGNIVMDKLLSVYDEEKAGGLKWNIINAPQHGYITGLPYSTKQLIDVHETKNSIYTNTDPLKQYDECIIEVTDGINSIRKHIKFILHPGIQNNYIHSNQILCAGTVPETITVEIPTGGDGNYTYSWQVAKEISKPSFQFITTQPHSNLQPGNIHQTTLFRRIVQSGGCTDTSQHVLIEVKTKGLWVGKQNSSWHSGNNWCGALVPDAQTDVTIQMKNVVQITDSAFCKSLQLLDQSRLILSGVLSYETNIISQQAILSVNGTLVASGKNSMLLPNKIFYKNQLDNLIIKCPELILSDSLYIKQSIQLLQGKLFTKDMLVLDTSAIIGQNASSTQLSGYITKLLRVKNNWLTNPFRENTVAVNEFPNNNLPPQIRSYLGFKSLTTNRSKFYSIQKNNQINYKKTIHWLPLEQDFFSLGSNLNRSTAVSSFYPFEEKNDALIQLYGQPIIGDEEVIFPSSIDTQYHLTGNPYLSKIISKSITRDGSLGHYFWVWDSSLAESGGYAAKAFEGNHVIQPLQGFIIKTLPKNDAFLQFAEQSKLIKLLPDSINGIIENSYQILASLYQDQQLLDKLLLLNIDTASIRYDEDDAEKFFNKDFNFYSLSYDQIPLAVDARSFSNQTYIPLGVQSKKHSTHSIKFERVWLPNKVQLELHDLFTGTITKVKQDSVYNFQISTDTASQGEKRFVLRAPIPPAPQEEPIIMKVSPVPAQDHLTLHFKSYKPGHSFILLKNMNGQILRKQILGQQQEGSFRVSLNGIMNGLHILEIHCGNKFAAATFIKL